MLVGGKLEQIHPSATWQDVIIPESAWFTPDYQQTAALLMHAFNNYDALLPNARKLATEHAVKFSYDAIFNRTKALIDKYVPQFAVEVPLKLPTLRKLT